MKLALTCHRTTEVLGKKETIRLGDDEIYPLVDGVEIGVKELRTFLRDCCCPRTRKVCQYCIAYGRFKMQRTFKLHIQGNNRGMFTCKDEDHPSIYINGGSSEDKLALDKEFVISVGTIIYMREPGGHRDDVKMEFHVVAIDDNEKEIVGDTGTSSTAIIETVGIIDNDDKRINGDATEAKTTATAVAVAIDVDVDAEVLGSNTLIATPISSTPVRIGSVHFALPVEGLLSNEAAPTFRSAPDPPDSTVKKLISRKDPIGESPKFRLQSPLPVRSPHAPVNKDEESWLQEPRMNATAKQMDYSTTNKYKKE
jgi:hypothetical protein